MVIAANERIDQVVFQSIEDFNTFARQATRISMRLCYCSTLNQCWIRDDREKDPSRIYQAVAACPTSSPDDFIDNEAAEPAVPTKEAT